MSTTLRTGSDNFETSAVNFTSLEAFEFYLQLLFDQEDAEKVEKVKSLLFPDKAMSEIKPFTLFENENGLISVKDSAETGEDTFLCLVRSYESLFS